jgi:hypothetical protein
MAPQPSPGVPGPRTGSRNTRADLAEVLRAEHRYIERLQAELTDPRTPTQQRVRLREALLAEVGRHFAMEARLLYPVVRQVLADGDEIAGHGAVAHDHVARSVLRLARTDVDAPNFPALVRHLVETVGRHLAEEESDLLPGLRRSLPPAALAALAGGIGGTDRRESNVAKARAGTGGERRDRAAGPSWSGGGPWLAERLRRANRLRELAAGRAAYPAARAPGRRSAADR